MIRLLTLILVLCINTDLINPLDRNLHFDPRTGHPMMLVSTPFGPQWIFAQPNKFYASPTQEFRVPTIMPTPTQRALHADTPNFKPTLPAHIRLSLSPEPETATESAHLKKEFDHLCSEQGPRIFITPDKLGNTSLHLAIAQGNTTLANLIFDALTADETSHILRCTSKMPASEKMNFLEDGDTVIHVALKHLHALIEKDANPYKMVTFLVRALPNADVDGKNFAFSKPSKSIFSARGFFTDHLASNEACVRLQPFFLDGNPKARHTPSTRVPDGETLIPLLSMPSSTIDTVVADVEALSLKQRQAALATKEQADLPTLPTIPTKSTLEAPSQESAPDPSTNTAPAHTKKDSAKKHRPHNRRKKSTRGDPITAPTLSTTTRTLPEASPTIPEEEESLVAAPSVAKQENLSEVEEKAINPLDELFLAISGRNQQPLNFVLTQHKKDIAKLSPWYNKEGITPLCAALKVGFIPGAEAIRKAFPAMVTQKNADGSSIIDCFCVHATRPEIRVLFESWQIEGIIVIGNGKAGRKLRTCLETAGLIDKPVLASTQAAPTQVNFQLLSQQKSLDKALKEGAIAKAIKLMQLPELREFVIHKIFSEPGSPGLRAVFSKNPQFLISILQQADLEPVPTLTSACSYDWIEFLYNKKCLPRELLLAQASDELGATCNALSISITSYQAACESGDDLITLATQLFIDELLGWLPLEAWLADMPDPIIRQMQEGLALMRKPTLKK